jgi:hypothetical protein
MYNMLVCDWCSDILVGLVYDWCSDILVGLVYDWCSDIFIRCVNRYFTVVQLKI